MINFSTELDRSGTTRMIISDTAPTVRETVKARPAAAPEPVAEPAAGEDWESLRDYVIEQIGRVVGAFPRDSRREKTVFMNFVGRWGDLALPIARYAFEESGGMWMGAPVGVFRFHRTSDGCFAQEIVKKIV